MERTFGEGKKRSKQRKASIMKRKGPNKKTKERWWEGVHEIGNQEGGRRD